MDSSKFYGQNIQAERANSDTQYGEINKTPIKFVKEKPIDIYKYTSSSSNKYINNIGLIFYNKPITETNKSGILYVRYFEGIQKGMLLQKLSNDNKYDYFVIDDVGTNGGMYLKYHEVKQFDTYRPYLLSGGNPTKLETDTTWSVDETKYQIKTFFRESDENAFYFYTTPQVDIQFENTSGLNFVTSKTPYINASKWEYGRTYGPGDYVYRDSDGKRRYYECIISTSVAMPGDSTDVDKAAWAVLGDGINVYNYKSRYNKDTIVWYQSIPDGITVSTYDKSVKYTTGAVVYYQLNEYAPKIYYKATQDIAAAKEGENGEIPGISNKWQELPGEYYISLTNIPAGIIPSGDNLGIYWEVYVGVLYEEDRGFKYELYSDLKAYKRGDIVFYRGKYYLVIKDIESEPPVDNKLWEKYTDITEDIEYPYGYRGYYNGRYCQCINDNGAVGPRDKDDVDNVNWEYVNEENGDIYTNGYRTEVYNDESAKYTDFMETEVYSVGRMVFYNGERYQMYVPQFNDAKSYSVGEYVYTITNDSKKKKEYFLCIQNVSGTNENKIAQPSVDKAHWLQVENVTTTPLISNDEYYIQYNSWSNSKLYKEGDIVLYNNKYYVYINDNHTKMNSYSPDITYSVGDLVRLRTESDGVVTYKWKYCLTSGMGNIDDPNAWTDINPEIKIDGYNPSEFWTEYYGFMYVGKYSENTYENADETSDSYIQYKYNDVVFNNNQYYIYVNPVFNGVGRQEYRGAIINTSLNSINKTIEYYKAGDPGYNVGDIVIYNDKYFICYNSTTDKHFSPSNRNYFALYPWQEFTTEISERTVVCIGEYEQQQYIQWKSVQWFLYDENAENVLDKSEILYDGDLTYTFHGVDGREKGK